MFSREYDRLNGTVTVDHTSQVRASVVALLSTVQIEKCEVWVFRSSIKSEGAVTSKQGIRQRVVGSADLFIFLEMS
jgi:hypothetical protein